MATKEQLLDVMRYGHGEIVRFTGQLSEMERNTIGEGDEWTVRDMLAHVIETLHQWANRTEMELRGEQPEPYGDNDERNAHMVADYRAKSWDEVAAMLQGVRAEMEALLDQLTAEELNDPQRLERLQGQPLWRVFAGNAITHPLAFHIRPWRNTHGQAGEATQQAEEEARLLLALGDAPSWHGNVYYNLACQYALTEQKDAALQRLGKALQLAPNMAEFARQDSDFDSLKGAPEFNALLADEPSPG